jgi:hypothetical protein
MKVQCKITGVWYDPDEMFKELFQQQWFIDMMKRMKDK